MPSKQQTRRSLSVTAQTYVRFRSACTAEGESMSGVLERLIADWCEGAGEREVSREDALAALKIERAQRADVARTTGADRCA